MREMYRVNGRGDVFHFRKEERASSSNISFKSRNSPEGGVVLSPILPEDAQVTILLSPRCRGDRCLALNLHVVSILCLYVTV